MQVAAVQSQFVNVYEIKTGLQPVTTKDKNTFRSLSENLLGLHVQYKLELPFILLSGRCKSLGIRSVHQCIQ